MTPETIRVISQIAPQQSSRLVGLPPCCPRKCKLFENGFCLKCKTILAPLHIENRIYAIWKPLQAKECVHASRRVMATAILFRIQSTCLEHPTYLFDNSDIAIGTLLTTTRLAPAVYSLVTNAPFPEHGYLAEVANNPPVEETPTTRESPASTVLSSSRLLTFLSSPGHSRPLHASTSIDDGELCSLPTRKACSILAYVLSDDWSIERFDALTPNDIFVALKPRQLHELPPPTEDADSSFAQFIQFCACLHQSPELQRKPDGSLSHVPCMYEPCFLSYLPEITGIYDKYAMSPVNAYEILTNFVKYSVNYVRHRSLSTDFRRDFVSSFTESADLEIFESIAFNEFTIPTWPSAEARRVARDREFQRIPLHLPPLPTDYESLPDTYVPASSSSVVLPNDYPSQELTPPSSPRSQRTLLSGQPRITRPGQPLSTSTSSPRRRPPPPN
jgi:hypothetical protein